MMKADSAQPVRSPAAGGPLMSGPAPDGRPPAPVRTLRSPADLLALRRLRYHLDLLETGYRQAIHPGIQAPSQRAERIALGIDRPELDTIPLWSVRRGDGAIAIPFIETVLRGILRDLDAGADAAAVFDPRADRRTRAGRRILERLLQAISVRPGHCERRDREDHYLPGDLVEQLCGSDSPLRRLGRSRLRAGVARRGDH